MIEALARQHAALEHLIGAVRQLEGLAVDEEELLLQARQKGSPSPKRWASGRARSPPCSPSAARAAIRPNTSAAARPLA